MKNRIFGNWKSTVAGFVAMFGQYLVLQGNSGFTWKTFLTALPTFVIGALSGDSTTPKQ